MTTQKRLRLAAGLVGLACWLWGVREARAASSTATLNIDVTITQSLSVAVQTSSQYSSTQSVAWNTGTSNAKLVNDGSTVNASSVTVINDSGGQTERWQLTVGMPGGTGSTIDNGTGGAGWTLQTTTNTLPGADQYAVQAVFGSSNTAANGCPGGTAAGWNSSTSTVLTTSLQTYGDTASVAAGLMVGTGLNTNGTASPDASSPNTGEMFAGNKRALCWRIIAPASTSKTNTQVVQIVVTALAP